MKEINKNDVNVMLERVDSFIDKKVHTQEKTVDDFRKGLVTLVLLSKVKSLLNSFLEHFEDVTQVDLNCTFYSALKFMDADTEAQQYEVPKDLVVEAFANHIKKFKNESDLDSTDVM